MGCIEFGNDLGACELWAVIWVMGVIASLDNVSCGRGLLTSLL